MSQIHFILTRPDRTMLLIQLAFNQSSSPLSSPEDHQRYLMRAVNQAIENVMSNDTISAHIANQTGTQSNGLIQSQGALQRSNSQIIRSSYNESRSNNRSTSQRPMLSPASSRASQSLFHSLSSMIETPRRTHPLTRQPFSTNLNSTVETQQSPSNTPTDSNEHDTAPTRSNLGALVSEFLHDSIRQTLRESLIETNEPEQVEDRSNQPNPYIDNPSSHSETNLVTMPPNSTSAIETSDEQNDQSSDHTSDSDMAVLPRPPPIQSTGSDMSDIDNGTINQSMNQSGDTDQAPLSRAMSEPHLTTEQTRTQHLNQEVQDQVTHRDVTCDSCGQSPIRGVRFKCRQCENFDFCAACHLACPIIGTHTKEHSYRVFTQPRPDPLVRALEDFLVLVLHSGFASVRLIGGVSSDTDAMAAIYQSMMGATHHQGTAPASKRAIDALEHLVVESDTEQICVFCQETLVIGDNCTLFPCDAQPHCYHSDCLLPWLKEHSNCPLCQKCIETVDEARANGSLDTIEEHSPHRSLHTASADHSPVWMIHLMQSRFLASPSAAPVRPAHVETTRRSRLFDCCSIM